MSKYWGDVWVKGENVIKSLHMILEKADVIYWQEINITSILRYLDDFISVVAIWWYL